MRGAVLCMAGGLAAPGLSSLDVSGTPSSIFLTTNMSPDIVTCPLGGENHPFENQCSNFLPVILRH